MQFRQRFNNVLTGVLAGLILPVIAFLVFFLLTRNGLSMPDYYMKILDAGNITSIMSVAIFANIIIFLLFNRLDMLRALKGVLGITIVWAFVVFGIKLF
ncbi:MAG: hypothetical protein GX622_13010 [Bacteroidales bacterium]|nr:hypothetical protein [Bacteroidales bacterium]